MPDQASETTRPPTFTLLADLQVMQWSEERMAVVFNPHSGNTFEVNEVAARLIALLQRGPRSALELMRECGFESRAQTEALQLQNFEQEYLLPLQQLDMLVERPE